MKLNEYFVPLQHQYERHVLSQMQQEDGEKMCVFAMRLYVQGERCRYGDGLEEHIKEMIIAKCKSSALLREMIKKNKMSYKEVLQMAKVYETVAEQEKLFKCNIRPVTVSETYNKIETKQNFKRDRVGERLIIQKTTNANDVVILDKIPVTKNVQRRIKLS